MPPAGSHDTAFPRDAAAEAILDTVKALPAVPPTMGRILSTTRDPNAGAEDLAEVVSLDPAVAAAVLRVANSPFYGQIGKISDLARAIVTIGFAEVANLVLSIGVFDMIQKGRRAGLDPMLFWEHSLACGILAQQFARDNGQVSPTDAFMGGLLHDIGKLVLDCHDGPRYAEVLRTVHATGRFVRDAERDAYGVNHAAVGEALVRRWNLPESVRFAVAYHHVPTTAEAIDLQWAMLVRIVHLADLFVRAMRLGSGGDLLVEDFSPRLLALIRLSGGQLERALAETRVQLARLKTSLGLGAAPAEKGPADDRPLAIVTAEDYAAVNMPYLTLASEPSLSVVLALSWGHVVERVEAARRDGVGRRVVVVVDSRRRADESLFLSTALASERMADVPVAFVGTRGGNLRHPRLRVVLEKPYEAQVLVSDILAQVRA